MTHGSPARPAALIEYRLSIVKIATNAGWSHDVAAVVTNERRVVGRQPVSVELDEIGGEPANVVE